MHVMDNVVNDAVKSDSGSEKVVQERQATINIVD